MPQDEQLAALASLHELFQKESLEYWLFGGWAVDFHAGDVTRTHDDLDVAVWAEDLSRVSSALEGDGWTHTPEDGEDGYTAFERNGVHLEVAFLARDEQGELFTPLRSGGRGEWPQGTFEKGRQRALRRPGSDHRPRRPQDGQIGRAKRSGDRCQGRRRRGHHVAYRPLKHTGTLLPSFRPAVLSGELAVP